jgi:hypothetical protein
MIADLFLAYENLQKYLKILILKSENEIKDLVNIIDKSWKNRLSIRKSKNKELDKVWIFFLNVRNCLILKF